MWKMECKRISHNSNHAILIYKIPKQLINDAVKFLEETVSIPTSSMISKKIVRWGLEVYFDGDHSFLKAILRGEVEIHRNVYQIYPLVTNLTVLGACAHVSKKTLEILMTSLGKVLHVYREKKPHEDELTNNYRVVIQHPEIPEKIQSWPESSAEIFGNDVQFPITFFCRTCRRNGHSRRQCPEAKLQNTLKTELQSTNEEDIKPILHSQYSRESEGSPNRLYIESGTQSKENISDVPLDLTSKAINYPEEHNNPTTSTADRKEETKSNVRKRKSFSHTALVPPSLRDNKKYFAKFCLGLIRTPNPFEVAKQYPRGIEVLLEQLSSFVRFNLDIMETRTNIEKRFIIKIDSLVPKLRYMLRKETISQTRSIEKPEHCTDITDFSLRSNADVANSKEVTNKKEHTAISKNNIATVSLDLDDLSIINQIPKKNGMDVMKTKYMQKSAETSGDSRNRKEFINSRKREMPKQAANKTTKKVKEGNKPNEKSANKLSMKVLKNTKDDCIGTSFADMMGSALRKCNIEHLISKKCTNIKPLKKLKIPDCVKPPKSSHNLKKSENATEVTHSCEDSVYETHDFSNFTSNCSNGMNLIGSKNNISVPGPSNAKIIDTSKFAKELYNASLSSYKQLYSKRKGTEKEITKDHQRIKKKGTGKVYDKERSLNICTENTATAFSEVKQTNEPKKSESALNTSPDLNRIISYSKGVLRQTEMKAFLMHVRNKRNPYKTAEKYSKDVGKIVEQLEAIVKKYYLGLRRNTTDDREIDRIDNLCERLRKHESGGSNQVKDTQNQTSIKTVGKTDLFERHFDKSSKVIKVEKNRRGYFCTVKTGGLNAGILIKNKDESQTGETNSSQLSEEMTNTVYKARHENAPKKPKSTLKISANLDSIISSTEGVLTSVDLKRFLLLVKNKKQPRIIAERFSKNVDQIIEQLETIVLKHQFGFTRNTIDDREIAWINNLCKRLGKSENFSEAAVARWFVH